jgi:chemotaxis response regulator CheB
VLADLAEASTSWVASADQLIHTLVHQYGPRTIAIVLSGALPAGVGGIRAVKRCGGIAIAQDATSSSHFEMPRAAIDFGKAEIVLPPSRMADALEAVAEAWSR